MATDTTMHDTAHAHGHDHHGVEDWSGGKPPMVVSYGKLMMW
jgi:hypothetical protein